jgi:hypothetical protein
LNTHVRRKCKECEIDNYQPYYAGNFSGCVVRHGSLNAVCRRFTLEATGCVVILLRFIDAVAWRNILGSSVNV